MPAPSPFDVKRQVKQPAILCAPAPERIQLYFDFDRRIFLCFESDAAAQRHSSAACA
jgi:hypothetical protein